MTQQTHSVPPNRTSLWTMLFVILIFLIGILIRWPYIKKEAGDAFKNRFSTEQKGEDVNPQRQKPDPKEGGMKRR